MPSRADYDPAFLDWVFWWDLATVELTDRILALEDKRASRRTPSEDDQLARADPQRAPHGFGDDDPWATASSGYSDEPPF